MSRQLPEYIDLLEYPWMRAQVLQYLLNPLARDGNLRLAHRLAPAHIPSIPPRQEPGCHFEDVQFRHLQSVRVLGYRPDLVVREYYHDQMKYGGVGIEVELDREGDLVLTDGCHRILYQLIAGAREIQARVRYRHPEWVALVARADSIAGGYVYQHLPHPDFNECIVGRRESRVPAVFEAVRGLEIRSAVDLGCCSGAFACDLVAVVPEVHGVELDPRFVELARWRSGKTGSVATFEQGDLLAWDGEADLVCTLSVLHHVVKIHGMGRVLGRLRGIRCRYLLMEYPVPGEPILQGCPDAEDFASWVAAGDPSMAGFRLVANLGIDRGFPATARTMYLWERTS